MLPIDTDDPWQNKTCLDILSSFGTLTSMYIKTDSRVPVPSIRNNP